MPNQRDLRKTAKALRGAGLHEEAAHFETHADVAARQRAQAIWDKARKEDPDLNITEVLDPDDIMRLSYDIRVEALDGPAITKLLQASHTPAAAAALSLIAGPDGTVAVGDTDGDTDGGGQ